MLNVESGPNSPLDGPEEENPLYDLGALTPSVHGRLVAEIKHISRQTNVPAKFIATPLANWLSPAEIDIVKSMPSWPNSGLLGMAYTGPVSCHQRLLAICGCMLRNFTDARYLTVQQLIEACKNDSLLRDVSVLALPDLYVSLQNGKSGMAPWQVSDLYEILQTRVSNGLVTLGYIDNPQRLKSDYGEAFYALIANYRLVNMKGA